MTISEALPTFTPDVVIYEARNPPSPKLRFLATFFGPARGEVAPMNFTGTTSAEAKQALLDWWNRYHVERAEQMKVESTWVAMINDVTKDRVDVDPKDVASYMERGYRLLRRGIRQKGGDEGMVEDAPPEPSLAQQEPISKAPEVRGGKPTPEKVVELARSLKYTSQAEIGTALGIAQPVVSLILQTAYKTNIASRDEIYACMAEAKNKRATC